MAEVSLQDIERQGIDIVNKSEGGINIDGTYYSKEQKDKLPGITESAIKGKERQRAEKAAQTRKINNTKAGRKPKIDVPFKQKVLELHVKGVRPEKMIEDFKKEGKKISRTSIYNIIREFKGSDVNETKKG